MKQHALLNLDPRAWVAWAAAASIIPLTGRNPFTLAVLLLIVLIVRRSLPTRFEALSDWSWFVRLAIWFSVISVVFNALTVRAGESVLFTIPRDVPLLDGPVTLNAVIYGALSGLALVILVLIGVTVSNVLDWSALLRLMPASLTGVAVAGSVAFLFLPQMARSYREIVDAHAVRGRQIHGLRDFATLGPALLSNGLDRAASMAALLESRSFGGAKRPDSRLRLHQASVAGGLASVCTTAYLISVNETDIAVIAGVSAGAFAVAAWRGLGQDDLPRTRFRQPDWSRDDSVIVLGAAVTMAGVLWSMRAHSGAIQYEPYPMLHAPFVGLPTLFSLLGLLAPAIVVSRSGGLTE